MNLEKCQTAANQFCPPPVFINWLLEQDLKFDKGLKMVDTVKTLFGYSLFKSFK